jgi:phospholipid/cholesterol/gamma-HCH transport system substrate-binding protein
MRRVLALSAIFIVGAALAIFAITAGDDGGDYKVRAIFENAGFVIPGEDVKVAGVKIGTIDSLDVTDDFKAAVVLKITDPGYQDFRQDAECTVRPQSLIGERFVECELTQARAVGEEPPPKLEQIKDGPGQGQYLLGVDHTSKAVDLDLINNIMREPVRERLSLILDDLGVGVAGRGEDLKVVIRRADPALKEVDKVLKILADQNDVLQRLAVDSDTILGPLARERKHVSGAIDNAGAVARATAERRVDLSADI